MGNADMILSILKVAILNRVAGKPDAWKRARPVWGGADGKGS